MGVIPWALGVVPSSLGQLEPSQLFLPTMTEECQPRMLMALLIPIVHLLHVIDSLRRPVVQLCNKKIPSIAFYLYNFERNDI